MELRAENKTKITSYSVYIKGAAIAHYPFYSRRFAYRKPAEAYFKYVMSKMSKNETISLCKDFYPTSEAYEYGLLWDQKTLKEGTGIQSTEYKKRMIKRIEAIDSSLSKGRCIRIINEIEKVGLFDKEISHLLDRAYLTLEKIKRESNS